MEEAGVCHQVHLSCAPTGLECSSGLTPQWKRVRRAQSKQPSQKRFGRPGWVTSVHICCARYKNHPPIKVHNILLMDVQQSVTLCCRLQCQYTPWPLFVVAPLFPPRRPLPVPRQREPAAACHLRARQRLRRGRARAQPSGDGGLGGDHGAEHRWAGNSLFQSPHPWNDTQDDGKWCSGERGRGGRFRRDFGRRFWAR